MPSGSTFVQEAKEVTLSEGKMSHYGVTAEALADLAGALNRDGPAGWSQIGTGPGLDVLQHTVSQ